MKYYDLLDLPSDATAEQIKNAYRILVQLHHPDRLQQANPTVRAYAEDKLKRINEAYTVLSDPDKRKRYNASLRQRAAEEDEPVSRPRAQPRPRDPQREAERAATNAWAEEAAEREAEQRRAAHARRAEQDRRTEQARTQRAEQARYPRLRPADEANPARVFFAPGAWASLIRIPAGEFLMGSDPARDPEAARAERPPHRVYVSEFFIGQYPVTNAHYQCFAPTPARLKPGTENHPVTQVAWEEATAFCQWLTRLTGRGFRLPTEAEWEKAARGPEGFVYPWGNVWEAGFSNVGHRHGGPMSVGQLSPVSDSGYGVGDMSGNVWEWCLDGYADRLYQSRAHTLTRDPRGPTEGPGCVVRGGAFDATMRQARCTYRKWYAPADQRANVGFRVVMEAGGTK